MDDLITALQIFRLYGDATYPTNCEHDILRVWIDPDIVPDKVKVELSELGFDIDDLGFYSTKFGSN